jgi:hypothetical protein
MAIRVDIGHVILLHQIDIFLNINILKPGGLPTTLLDRKGGS